MEDQDATKALEGTSAQSISTNLLELGNSRISLSIQQQTARHHRVCINPCCAGQIRYVNMVWRKRRDEIKHQVFDLYEGRMVPPGVGKWRYKLVEPQSNARVSFQMFESGKSLRPHVSLRTKSGIAGFRYQLLRRFGLAVCVFRDSSFDSNHDGFAIDASNQLYLRLPSVAFVLIRDDPSRGLWS